MIAEERERQIDVEGFTKEGDDDYQEEQLARAAACYAIPKGNRSSWVKTLWPFLPVWFKPAEDHQNETKDRIRELVKAGALIVAEIERLQRLAHGNTKTLRVSEG